jgi:hypothetical protein
MAFCFLFLFSAFLLRAADTSLVNHTDTWRYYKGTNAPQTNWQTVSEAALDATWGVGNGGFGYADNTSETNNCQTLLPDMRNGYTTLYIRRTFEVTNPLTPPTTSNSRWIGTTVSLRIWMGGGSLRSLHPVLLN